MLYTDPFLVLLCHFFMGCNRTYHMVAMHHDTSSDLKVVGNKLKDILEVCKLF